MLIFHVDRHTVEQIRLTNISKFYGRIRANDQASFHINQGEIKALLGENGAGKSTLVKIICGITKPDQGEIIWQGHPTQINNPKIAKKMGIGMVFQHFSLFEALSVVDNIALSLDDVYHKKTLIDKINRISEQYGLPIHPNQQVCNLSVGAKQRIEIIRCLMQNPKLLILDEPTAVLTPQEAERLFITLRQLANQGCAILFISHRLNEVRELCDSATIMRGGKTVGNCIPKEKTSRQIAELMLGETLQSPEKKPQNKKSKTVLKVSQLNLDGNVELAQSPLKNISFSIQAGEIFGIAGIAGNGQNELLSVLSGEIKLTDNKIIELNNQGIAATGIAERRSLGLGVSYVPEERLGHGAVAEMSLSDNVLLTATQKQQLTRHGIIYHRQCEQLADNIISQFNVKANGNQTLASELSGGNLQKFIVGREIVQQPKVILAAQPTWGVDAGAASQIQQALLDLASKGCAILLVSQDLDELFTISHRMAVMFEGGLSKTYTTDLLSSEEVGMLMVGEAITLTEL